RAPGSPRDRRRGPARLGARRGRGLRRGRAAEGGLRSQARQGRHGQGEEEVTSHLAVTVRLHEPRWHGLPEWPPAPARLFQALVAGASQRLAEPAVQAAYRWLEGLEPPLVVAPRQIEGRSVTYFVPNNDLDAKGGDPERVSEIRAGKVVRPRLLQADVPFVYAWAFQSGAD